MRAEIKLSVEQKAKVGEIIRKLNKSGAVITASIFGEVLRVYGSPKDIQALKSKLTNPK